MSQHRVCAAVLLGAVLVSPACILVVTDWGGGIDHGSRSQSLEAVEEIHIPADGIARLSCTSRTGNLSVIGNSEVEEIAVVARMRAWGASQAEAEENLGRIQIAWEVRGDRVLLGWDWSGSRPDRAPAFVGFDIEAPARLAIALDSYNGNIDVNAAFGTMVDWSRCRDGGTS